MEEIILIPGKREENRNRNRGKNGNNNASSISRFSDISDIRVTLPTNRNLVSPRPNDECGKDASGFMCTYVFVSCAINMTPHSCQYLT